MLPHVVPRLRTAMWATCGIAMAISGSLPRNELRIQALRRDEPARRSGLLAAIGDAAQRIDPVDIDQHLRRRQPHVQRRHQALAAGQDLRAAGVIGKQRQSLVDVAGTPIKKRGAFIGASLEPSRIQLGTKAVTMQGITKISAIISMVSQT